MEVAYAINSGGNGVSTGKIYCCGTDMLPDKELENTIIYKCKECGLTDSRLKDIG
jgi:hypothetical protein